MLRPDGGYSPERRCAAMEPKRHGPVENGGWDEAAQSRFPLLRMPTLSKKLRHEDSECRRK